MKNEETDNKPDQSNSGVDESVRKSDISQYILSASILLSATIISIGLVNGAKLKIGTGRPGQNSASTQGSLGNNKTSALEEKVLPSEGVAIPVRWGDLGKQMVEGGVIDRDKFITLYAQRGGLTPETEALLTESENGQLVMTSQNSGIILNLLWALGLGNKNDILEKGPMQNAEYGGAGRFASTGGWTLAQGAPMTHYSKHSFLTLTPKQQLTVALVSRNIYRPCCGNATNFPDCNHGMAMLGLLELMASQGVSEEQMYRTALAVNSYWFPDTYLTIAQYLESKGMDWNSVDPREILGVNYSSAQGYKQIIDQTQPVQGKSAGGCGV